MKYRKEKENNNKKETKFSLMKKEVREIIINASINIVLVIIAIVLNQISLKKNNNYINLVKNSSNSLSNFEKFWCNAVNNELIILIIYSVILLAFIIIEIILYRKAKFLKSKIKIKINFAFSFLFYICFSLINFLIVNSIIFISISPVKYPGVFHIANKNKSLTLDEEIEIEDAADEFQNSKFVHSLYIIILFIILYLNILISRSIYKSIIYNQKEEKKEENAKEDEKEDVKENKKEDEKENKKEDEIEFVIKDVEEDEKKDEKNDEKKVKNEDKKDQMEEEYIWKYPRIDDVYKFLECFYFGLYALLHLSAFLFQLNIYTDEKYIELLKSLREGEIETPKNYFIINNYGIFEKVITIMFFILNSISFVIIIISMFIKMLSKNITECLDSILQKFFPILLSSNILYSIFVILSIAFSCICHSSFNELEKNENVNFFVIKKKLIGQIIAYLFILVFLIIIIIDNFRLSCILKEKKRSSDNNSSNNKQSENKKRDEYTKNGTIPSTERPLNIKTRKKKKLL